MRWTILSFVSEGGDVLITDWFKGQGVKTKAAFIISLKYLRDLPIDKWVRPSSGSLKRECNGLVEIRFKADDKEHRPLGFFSPSQTFTIVFFAIEKDRKFIPPDACKIALQRRDLILNHGGRTREWTIF